MSNHEWTPALRRACAERCAYPYGEPPCWRLPDLVGERPENIEPCDECLREVGDDE